MTKVSNKLYDAIAKNLLWIIVAILGCFGINTLADHLAMKHGYSRQFKIGPLETRVEKIQSNISHTT